MIKLASAESNTVSTATGGTSSEEEVKLDHLMDEDVMKEKLLTETEEVTTGISLPAKVQRTKT